MTKNAEKKKIEENFIKWAQVKQGALIHEWHHHERVLNSLASDIDLKEMQQGTES